MICDLRAARRQYVRNEPARNRVRELHEPICCHGLRYDSGSSCLTGAGLEGAFAKNARFRLVQPLSNVASLVEHEVQDVGCHLGEPLGRLENVVDHGMKKARLHSRSSFRVAVLSAPGFSARRRLRVVDRLQGLGVLFSCAVEFGPDLPPVVRTQILAPHSAFSRALDPNAVLWARHTARVLVPPLAQLSIALNGVAESFHAFPQFGDGRCEWGGEVLVEIHARILVAVATSCKQRLLCVAGATL